MSEPVPRRASDGQATHNTRVLLIGERFLLIDALRLALGTEQISVAATGNHRPGMEQAINAFDPTVVIFDGSETPIEAGTRLIRSLKESGRIVVGITSEGISVEAAQLVNAGADCVVGLDAGFEDLTATIKRSLSSEPLMPLDRRYTLEQLLREHRSAEQRRWLCFEELTKRERVIFSLVYEGLSADQIADDACVSVSTVRSHIRNILIKLNVNSQLAAVAMARSHDWFGTESVSGIV